MPKLPQASLALPAGQTDVLIARARSAHAAGRPDEAERLLRRARSIDPLHKDVIKELGLILEQRGALLEAMEQFETFTRIDPKDPLGWWNFGAALLKAGAFPEALACFENHIQLRPSDLDGHWMRADTLHYLGRFAEAATAYAALATLDDRALIGLGVTQAICGQDEAARNAFDRALAANPDDAAALYAKAQMHLRRGDFPAGLPLFEHRWALQTTQTIRSDRPVWHGETNLTGKIFYIHWEQGLGDSLQFCRYIPLAAAAGATIILEVLPALSRLMTTLDGAVTVITPDDPIPPHDLRCPMLSLPLAFGTMLETIPASMPYLRAHPAAKALWCEKLRDVPGKKIGLVWAGGSRAHLARPAVTAVEQRTSLILNALRPLASIPGCSLVSIQLGPDAASIVPPPPGMILHDHTADIHDFADTAALIENLDLIISVDTSTAHLAGAMGKPVWLLNRFDTCWRWFLDREDSPWYPSMRIFRQPTPGDWTTVIQNVTAALRDFAA